MSYIIANQSCFLRQDIAEVDIVVDLMSVLC